MKIKSIKTGFVEIPLKRPFKTALRTVDTVRDILVKVETENGLCGYGEAPPTAVITGDTTGSIVEAIEHFIAPALVGQDLNYFDDVMYDLEQENTVSEKIVVKEKVKESMKLDEIDEGKKSIIKVLKAYNKIDIK